jgi:hypothetical protein
MDDGPQEDTPASPPVGAHPGPLLQLADAMAEEGRGRAAQRGDAGHPGRRGGSAWDERDVYFFFLLHV